MKVYKINRDNKERLPSDETVKKHQSFPKLKVRHDEVLKRSKVPLYKNPRMFLFLLLVALVAYLIYMEYEAGENPSEENGVEQVESTGADPLAPGN